MDHAELIEILRATIDPNQRNEAEKQLEQIHQIIGFAPSLLQVVMSNEVTLPVRQAGAVYLKNLVTRGWYEKDPTEQTSSSITYSIHDQDRAMIRDIIVEAIVQSPDVLRIQLCLALKIITKCDFPARWTQIVDKIHIYLQNPDPSNWMGALLCLYNVIKNYEYYSADKRGPLIEAMNLLLPILYNIMITLQNDQSAESILIQKQILKCYFALIKYTLSLELHTTEVFTKWMEILRKILEQPVPDHTLQVEEDERMELPWWKIKKWSIHILFRLFERYGSPIHAREEYAQFATWYLTTFTGGILDVLFMILEQYRNKIYVSPRVLQQSLIYINDCVGHGHSWKLLKPHMFGIIKYVLFPMLSYTEADEELWNTDPHEYIRIKFDIFEDFVSPLIAAQTLLTSSCKKRKGVLEDTMQLCMEVLTSQNGEYGPRQRDGAFHMVGTLHNILLKKKNYREEVSTLLEQYVYPEFRNPLGHMRARVCWVLQCFASVRFKNDNQLLEAIRLTTNALLHDAELPVKVEAAIAIQMLLSSQEKCHGYLEPQVQEITSELLIIIRETENDNIANVLQKIVPLYTAQLLPMAYEITDHLATTFSKVIETDATDEKAITAMGLLNTLETVLSAMEDNPLIMEQIEKTVLRVVGHILHHNIIEYYEEAMSLLCNLTTKRISPDMWKVLELIYQVFEKDGFDYFTDMVPLLHNYITVGTEAFLADQNYILAVFNMCKVVLSSENEDESEVYAAKLLEVTILQCTESIHHCWPSVVELVLQRLMRKKPSNELRLMLLEVLIAMVYVSPYVVITIMENMQSILPKQNISLVFVKQWLSDINNFVGIHDRKLCILGLCSLLEMSPVRQMVTMATLKFLPACLTIFDGLKRAYETRADADEESSSDEEEGEEETDLLSSDEDDIEEMSNEYLENLARMVVKNSNEQGFPVTARIEQDAISDDDDDEEYDPNEAPIECYTTPLEDKDCPVDEYIRFKSTLQGIAEGNPSFYAALTSQLTEQQKKKLNAVYVLADQRKAQQDSKMIEQQGGYSFTVPESVPTKFKFGS